MTPLKPKFSFICFSTFSLPSILFFPCCRFVVLVFSFAWPFFSVLFLVSLFFNLSYFLLVLFIYLSFTNFLIQSIKVRSQQLRSSESGKFPTIFFYDQDIFFPMIRVSNQKYPGNGSKFFGWSLTFWAWIQISKHYWKASCCLSLSRKKDYPG